MANQHVIDRVAAIQQMLMAVYAAGNPMSASTKGQERQQFIDNFLAHALPSIYRFGTGDATDANGNRSGQLDVVIEYPFGPTIPVGGDKPTRLYLAESVAAVVEVKSDVSGQWDEARRTARALAPVARQIGATMSFGPSPHPHRIPLFVVGYKGWKTLATVKEKLAECPEVAGILVIESGVYCSANFYSEGGPKGLWALICDLYHHVSGLQSAVTDPFSYIQPTPPVGIVNATNVFAARIDYPVSPSGITKGGIGLGIVKP